MYRMCFTHSSVANISASAVLRAVHDCRLAFQTVDIRGTFRGEYHLECIRAIRNRIEAFFIHGQYTNHMVNLICFIVRPLPEEAYRKGNINHYKKGNVYKTQTFTKEHEN